MPPGLGREVQEAMEFPRLDMLAANMFSGEGAVGESVVAGIIAWLPVDNKG